MIREYLASLIPSAEIAAAVTQLKSATSDATRATSEAVAVANNVRTLPLETVVRMEAVLNSNQLLSVQIDRMRELTQRISDQMDGIQKFAEKTARQIRTVEAERDSWRSQATNLNAYTRQLKAELSLRTREVKR